MRDRRSAGKGGERGGLQRRRPRYIRAESDFQRNYLFAVALFRAVIMGRVLTALHTQHNLRNLPAVPVARGRTDN